jgi:hypothetical protein
MQNMVFWIVTLHSLETAWHSKETYFHLLLLVSCLAYYSALKMGVICSCETSGFLQTIRHYSPGGLTLQLIIQEFSLLGFNTMQSVESQPNISKKHQMTFSRLHSAMRSWASAVGTAGWPWSRSSSPGRVKNFSSPHRPDQLWGPPSPILNGIPGAISPGVKRPGRGTDHSPQTSAKVMKMWIYTSISPYAFMA